MFRFLTKITYLKTLHRKNTMMKESGDDDDESKSNKEKELEQLMIFGFETVLQAFSVLDEIFNIIFFS